MTEVILRAKRAAFRRAAFSRRLCRTDGWSEAGGKECAGAWTAAAGRKEKAPPADTDGDENDIKLSDHKFGMGDAGFQDQTVAVDTLHKFLADDKIFGGEGILVAANQFYVGRDGRGEING